MTESEITHNTEGGLEKLRISSSGLDKFNSCPRRWAFYYLDEKPDKAGPPALIGSYVHEILEVFYQEKKKDRTEDAIKEIAKSQWDDFQTEYEDDIKDGEALSEFEIYDIKTQAWLSLSSTWTVEDPKEVNVHSTEMRLEAKFEGVPFLGFVDRLDHLSDGSLVAVDYKTGKVPQPKFTASKLMQLLLYGWALEQLGIETSKAKLYFLKGQTVIGTDVNNKSIKEVKKFLSKSVDGIKQAFEEGFNPKTGPLCGWCPYILDCPEGEEFVYKMKSFNRIRKDAPAFELLASRGKQDELSAEELQKLFEL